MNRLLLTLAVALVLGLAPATLAAADNFTTIDYPGATSTNVRGINDSGAIVGNFTAAGVNHGFLLSGDKFTPIDFPDARSTTLYGINSSGDIVGMYADSGNVSHGFLLSKGKFTSVDYPGAAMTGVLGISAAGDMVGHIQLPQKPMQGFILRRGAWTVIDYRPDAPSNSMNCYYGINDAGATVGHWATWGTRHGVMYKDGKYTQIDYGGGGYTETLGINAAGDIVGYFRDAAQGTHGYLLRNGRFTRIDVPDARQTMANGINSAGDIAGAYTDAAGKSRGFATRFAPPAPPQVLTVDDNGLDCPGALRTIQEAVTQASPGATIRVCPGTYLGTVKIVGRAKDGLTLIAIGGEDEVVLQGDYTEGGFDLRNVNSVTIRGFTVRDFGYQAVRANIYLQNVNYSTIEFNRLMNSDGAGIWVEDSGNNVVQSNTIVFDKPDNGNCGMHMGGAKSVNNFISRNTAHGGGWSGIMISGAGPGNVVSENVLNNNGRYGIQHEQTTGTRIVGNRVSYNRGPVGGISIDDSDQVTVFDNRARNNTPVDLKWDGKGTLVFEANACDTSTPAGACGR